MAFNPYLQPPSMLPSLFLRLSENRSQHCAGVHLNMAKYRKLLREFLKTNVFKTVIGERGGKKDRHATSFFFFFSVQFLCSSFSSRFHHLLLHSFNCLAVLVSTASRRTHPSDPRRSWLWGSCCGCRRPPRPRSGRSGQGSSGCWLRRPWLPSRTVSESESVHLRRSPAPPWRTGRIQSRCRNTGRSWTGSFGTGCLSRVGAGRCGI